MDKVFVGQSFPATNKRSFDVTVTRGPEQVFVFTDEKAELLRADEPLAVEFRPDAGDVVTLVLIRGSNLAAPVGGGAVNLTDRGFHRHRVVWVREMTADEVRTAGRGEPTIDAIEIAEFESHAELKAWLGKTAPAFQR